MVDLHFVFEVFHVEQWAIVVIAQALEEEFAAVEQIAFDVELEVRSNEPEVGHIGMLLKERRDDPVQLLVALCSHQQV